MAYLSSLVFWVVLTLPLSLAALSVYRRAPEAVRPAVIRVLAISAAGGLASWIAFMSWGNSTHYELWQGVASGVAMVVTVVAGVWTSRIETARRFDQRTCVVAVAPAIVLYSLGWTFVSGPSDETGLWGVGLVFLLVGTTVGLAIVAAIAERIRASTR